MNTLDVITASLDQKAEVPLNKQDISPLYQELCDTIDTKLAALRQELIDLIPKK